MLYWCDNPLLWYIVVYCGISYYHQVFHKPVLHGWWAVCPGWWKVKVCLHLQRDPPNVVEKVPDIQKQIIWWHAGETKQLWIILSPLLFWTLSYLPLLFLLLLLLPHSLPPFSPSNSPYWTALVWQKQVLLSSSVEKRKRRRREETSDYQESGKVCSRWVSLVSISYGTSTSCPAV